MKFRIDNLGEGSAYVDIETKEGWIEFAVGYANSARRAIVTGISSNQAFHLAQGLRILAEHLEQSKPDEG